MVLATFDKYLNGDIMKMIHDIIAKEIGEHAKIS